MKFTAEELAHLNQQFANAMPQEILAWAWKQFGTKLGATSSFQTQSVPLLHMISTTTPELPIYFLDTSYHFAETLTFRDQLVTAYGLQLRVLTANLGNGDVALQMAALHRSNPDLCCAIHKVMPLRQAKQGLDAWISGIRRDQTETRRNIPIIGIDSTGQYKIAPLANWSSREVWRYSNQYDLPMHPLAKEGYMSIGCAPCTRAIHEGEDERSGRWAGKSKVECGLHTRLGVRAA